MKTKALSILVLLLALAAPAPRAANAEPPLATCLHGGPTPPPLTPAFPASGSPAGSNGYEWKVAFPNLVFDRPVLVTSAGDGSGRLFVIEERGVIRVFPNDSTVTQAGVFLDISDRVSYGDERGLLGLAFAPDFATSGVFYVNFTATSAVCSTNSICTRVERFRVSADPNVADPSSSQLILEFMQPYGNHNGGMMAFGPKDGLLYVSTGDGGSAGDPEGNGQNRKTLLGAMLRIDVSRADPGLPYAIPPTNPYAGNSQGFREEIWAYGLRNPWRFSFDRETGDLWIGDVGQNAFEEVDYVPASQVAAGGQNFGWNVCEANADFQGSCDALASTRPLYAYGRDLGQSVIGGYVYRGQRLPGLVGAYVFADYLAATSVMPGGAADPAVSVLDDAPVGFSSFGEDEAGELYGANLGDGKIYWLVPRAGGGDGWPALLSQTGLFSDTAALTPVPGLVEYRVNSKLWSDGAKKRRFVGLPPGGAITFSETGPWDFPLGTVLVKHFELKLLSGKLRRLETRVFVHQQDGWTGATYRWNNLQQDAKLVLATEHRDFDVAGPAVQTWTFPSPSDCLACHTDVEGRVLGLRTRQVNRSVDCEATSENQLDAWNEVGLFDTDVGPASGHPAYVDPENTNADNDARARSYLAVNCAICHQPGGPAPTDIDLRFDTPLAQAHLLGVPPVGGGFGLVDPRRVFPGDHTRSVLWHRVQTTVVADRMPQKTAIPDPVAVSLLADWIDALPDQSADSDGDSVVDIADNCTQVANPGQEDADGDLFGDRCDCDFDGDQVCLNADRAIAVADSFSGVDRGVGTDMDSDGDVDSDDLLLFDTQRALGEPGPSGLRTPRDRDHDGVSDGVDDCTWMENPSQVDTDGDGFGNLCDCDLDQNGVCALADIALFNADRDAGGDSGIGSDIDGDGDVDGTDAQLLLYAMVNGVPGPSLPGGNLTPDRPNVCGRGSEVAAILVPPLGIWVGRRRRARRPAREPGAADA